MRYKYHSILLVGWILGHASILAGSVSSDMTTAAQYWLASLSPEQRAQATFAFDDAQRTDWHFIPMERKGLPMREMQPAQQLLARALLATGLSAQGNVTATTIMSLEQVLHEMENQSPRRDPLKYHVFIFGQPCSTGTWGWRVEGHHLSVHFTVVKGEVAGSPTFFGSNPATIKEGPLKGLQTLASEENLGRELIRSMNAQQRGKAIYTEEAPKDILSGVVPAAERLEDFGIAYGDLNESQQDLLKKLVQSYVNRVHSDLAERDWDKIQRAGWSSVKFAWAGGIEVGQPHYYRIQGPTFLAEYDNVQNGNNHVHSVWRDFKGDLGADLLQRHYQQVH